MASAWARPSASRGALRGPRPRPLRRTSHVTRAEERKFRPADAVSGDSAERRAAKMLNRLFTYCAICQVQMHLEGAGNDGGFIPQNVGLGGGVEAPPYARLRAAMEEIPLGDGDEWVREMLKRDPEVGLRVLEARRAYAMDGFDFEELKRESQMLAHDANTALMQEHVARSSGGGGGG